MAELEWPKGIDFITFSNAMVDFWSPEISYFTGISGVGSDNAPIFFSRFCRLHDHDYSREQA